MARLRQVQIALRTSAGSACCIPETYWPVRLCPYTGRSCTATQRSIRRPTRPPRCAPGGRRRVPCNRRRSGHYLCQPAPRPCGTPARLRVSGSDGICNRTQNLRRPSLCLGVLLMRETDGGSLTRCREPGSAISTEYKIPTKNTTTQPNTSFALCAA